MRRALCRLDKQDIAQRFRGQRLRGRCDNYQNLDPRDPNDQPTRAVILASFGTIGGMYGDRPPHAGSCSPIGLKSFGKTTRSVPMLHESSDF